MSRTPMLAVGLAAALALGLTAAQAQTTTTPAPNATSPGTTAPNATAPGAASPNATSQPSMNNRSATAQRASKADERFLTAAMEGDMAEVQMGKLAQQKGQSEDVKQFGQMLEQDHSQHLQQAQQQAQQLGITPPQGPNARQKTVYEQMNKLSGARFDRQFARHMVQDHRQDIAMFQREAKSHRPLAQFAQQAIPTLQKHLQTAEAIMNKGAMTGSRPGAR